MEQHGWVAFSARAKAPLIFWDRSTMGNYTAESWCRYILPSVTNFIREQEAATGRPHFFVLDNAPSHKANRTKLQLRQLAIDALPHPPSSPDLNVAENVIGETIRRVEDRQRMFNNSEAFRAVIREAYNEIDQAWIRNQCATMPRRLKAVLRCKSGPTEY